MKSIKRILAIIMVMAMLLALVVINASAAPVAPLTINGNPIYSTGNIDLGEGNGTAYFSKEAGALSLTNAKIASQSDNNTIEIAENLGNFTITINGNCEIGVCIDKDAIHCKTGTSLSIEGREGSKLTIKGSAGSSGIYVYDSNPTMSEVTYVFEGNESNAAICAPYGVTIGDCSLTATGCWRGILVSMGSLNTVIKNTTFDFNVDDFGIYAYNYPSTGSLTIENCEGTIVSRLESILAYNTDINLNGKNILDLKTTQTTKNCIYSSQGALNFNLTGDEAIIRTESTDKALYATTINVNTGYIILPVGGVVSTDKTTINSKTGEAASKVTIAMTIPPVEYNIMQTEAELTWERGCCDVLKVTSDAAYNIFEKILVDGVELPKTTGSNAYDNYSVMSGSTIVFLSAGYLENLSVGKHTIEIVSEDGSAKGTFTIVEAAKTEEETKTEEKIADTSDNSAIAALVALTAFSAAGFVSLKKKEN